MQKRGKRGDDAYQLKPVRVRGHPGVPPPGGDSKSVVEVGNPKMEDVRASNTAGNETKICTFYKDEDYRFSGVKIAINPRKYKKFDTLTLELSRKIPGLAFGVRTVSTPGGKDRIHNLETLTNGGKYVCSSNRTRVRGLDMNRIGQRQAWRTTRPPSGRRLLNDLLKEDMFYSSEAARFRKAKKLYDMSTVYNNNAPKKVTVLRNGDPTQRHVMLLNRKTAQTFEQVLGDLSDMFKFAVRKLYTINEKKVFMTQ